MTTLSEALEDSIFEDDIPEGFKTTTEWCDSEGLGASQTGKKIRLLVELGKMECRHFRVIRNNVLRNTPYYRLKDA